MSRIRLSFGVGMMVLLIQACTTESPTDVTSEHAGQLAAVADRGAYDANCAFCHGDFDQPAAVGKKVLGARSCSIDASIYGTWAFPGGVPSMQWLQGRLVSDQILEIEEFLNSEPVTGQERYVTACASCHGADGSGGLVGDDIRGEGDEVGEAISDESEMNFLGCLPDSDLEAIAMFLGSDKGDKGDKADKDDDDDKGDKADKGDKDDEDKGDKGDKGDDEDHDD